MDVMWLYFSSIRVLGPLVAIAICCGTLQGGLVYTFSGQIPSVGSQERHLAVAPGENWIATFFVDENTPSTAAGAYLRYEAAVTGGKLTFSGGYTSPISFIGAHITVVNNDVIDSIIVQTPSASGDRVHIQSISYTNPLSSLELPGPGTYMKPTPDPAPTGVYQLNYRDDLGTIEYTAADRNNVVLRVMVPEPASLAIASIAGASFALARRRRS